MACNDTSGLLAQAIYPEFSYPSPGISCENCGCGCISCGITGATGATGATGPTGATGTIADATVLFNTSGLNGTQVPVAFGNNMLFTTDTPSTLGISVTTSDTGVVTVTFSTLTP